MQSVHHTQRRPHKRGTEAVQEQAPTQSVLSESTNLDAEHEISKWNSKSLQWADRGQFNKITDVSLWKQVHSRDRQGSQEETREEEATHADKLVVRTATVHSAFILLGMAHLPDAWWHTRHRHDFSWDTGVTITHSKESLYSLPQKGAYRKRS